jgi:hypothetical protein
MNKTLPVLILFGFCVLSGCSKKATNAPAVAASATPAAAVDTGQAFSSPEALTKFLEHRWPLKGVQTFCIPERRHNNAFQNLVMEGSVWRGTLFPNQDSGFEEISWYANTKNGRATIYSLGARKGEDFWLLEIADEDDVKQPADFAPDPKLGEFVGHK